MPNKRVSASNILVKECIISALLQLIKEKPLSSISISELCSKAGVSRMTFYRNYTSKEEIISKHLEEIFNKYKEDNFEKFQSGMFCDLKHITHYFEYVYLYRDFLDGMVSCGFGVLFLNMLNEYMTQKWGMFSDQYTLGAFAGSLYNLFRMESSKKSVIIRVCAMGWYFAPAHEEHSNFLFSHLLTNLFFTSFVCGKSVVRIRS